MILSFDDNVKLMAANILKEMFASIHFSICDVDKVLDLLNRHRNEAPTPGYSTRFAAIPPLPTRAATARKPRPEPTLLSDIRIKSADRGRQKMGR